MTTPTVTETRIAPHGAMPTREVYHAPSDFYVVLESVDSKSRATIVHPYNGRMVVPCAELREVKR